MAKKKPTPNELSFVRFLWKPGDVVVVKQGAQSGDLSTPHRVGSGRRRTGPATSPVERPESPSRASRPSMPRKI